MRACGKRHLFTLGSLRPAEGTDFYITNSNINIFDIDEMVINFFAKLRMH
jgi:hypothetical protein